jgi:hypothetical protein
VLTGHVIWAVVVLGLAAFSVAIAIALVIDARTTVHLDRPCVGNDTSDCLARAPARVISADSGSSIKVQDDDGTHGIDLSGAPDFLPAEGARVTLERWNGDVVSVLDARSERRYHTLDWPSPWLDGILALIFVAIAAAILTADLGWLVPRLRARRRRVGLDRRDRGAARSMKRGR